MSVLVGIIIGFILWEIIEEKRKKEEDRRK